MQRNNNTITLNEQEFNRMIENTVMEVIAEGLGDKVKSGLKRGALGALGAGMGLGIFAGANADMDRRESNRYAQYYNSPEMQAEIDNFLEEYDLEDTPKNREMAWGYLYGKVANESKFQSRLAHIIREEISKAI